MDLHHVLWHDHRPRLDSQPPRHVARTLELIARQQEVDVEGRTGASVDRHGEPSAHAEVHARVLECGEEGAKLVEQVQ